jgi:hypothetical protein
MYDLSRSKKFRDENMQKISAHFKTLIAALSKKTTVKFAICELPLLTKENHPEEINRLELLSIKD